MKPKLSRRLRWRHKYPVLLAQETTHLHSLCSVVVRVCTRIRKGHWTASRHLLKDDTGHQVIRHAQRHQRVGKAALNMSVKWFERLENPKQSQSWRTGNSALERETEEIPNVAARKWARGPSKSSIQEGLSEKAADRKTVYYGTVEVVWPSTGEMQGGKTDKGSSCPVWWTQYKQTNPANSIRRHLARTYACSFCWKHCHGWIGRVSHERHCPNSKRFQQHVSAPLCFVSCR